MDTAAEFAELALALHDQDVEHTLHDIAQLAREGLDCDHVGVYTTSGRTVETAAATDQLIERADERQTQVGQGPCLDAIWTHDTFIVRDTATDARWPVFGPIAAELGLHSILSVRLYDDVQTLGALNMYSTTVREFDPDDVALAHIFGSHASVALSSARKEEGLLRAVDARHLIGLAQGILMERFGLDADQAFSVLRRYSQDNNVKLREVAEHVIATRALPGND